MPPGPQGRRASADRHSMRSRFLLSLSSAVALWGAGPVILTKAEQAHLDKAKAEVYARDLPEGWKDFYQQYDEARRLDWQERKVALERSGLAPTLENSGGGPRQQAVLDTWSNITKLDAYTVWRDVSANVLLSFGKRIGSHDRAWNWCAGRYSPFACNFMRERVGLPRR